MKIFKAITQSGEDYFLSLNDLLNCCDDAVVEEITVKDLKYETTEIQGLIVPETNLSGTVLTYVHAY